MGQRTPRRAAAAVLALLAVTLSTVADRADEGAPPPYKVIIERDLSVLEQRLQSAAARGYRIVAAADGSAGFARASDVIVHLEPRAEGEPTVDYRVLSGPYSGRLEKLVNGEAAKGFRVLREGVLRKITPNPIGGRERRQTETPVLILERTTQGPPNEYELLAPGTPEQFDRELARESVRGFRLTGLQGFAGGWLLTVLERPIVERPPGPEPEGFEPRVIAVKEHDRKKLFEAVGRAAARGYRVVKTVANGFAGRGDAVILERATVPGRPYSYYFLGRPGPDELESRLAEGAAANYRFLSGLDPLVELLMERGPLGHCASTYRTVSAGSEVRLESEVVAALEDGYVFAGLYGPTVVLERHAAAPRGGEAAQGDPGPRASFDPRQLSRAEASRR